MSHETVGMQLQSECSIGLYTGKPGTTASMWMTNSVQNILVVDFTIFSHAQSFTAASAGSLWLLEVYLWATSRRRTFAYLLLLIRETTYDSYCVDK